jgi:lysophospholipase L1-like esterase
MRPWPTKPLLVIATFCATITLPQFFPAFYNWRVFEWCTVPTVLDFRPRPSAVPVEDERERLRPDTVPKDVDSHRIVDPAHALDAFYKSLLQTERQEPGAVTRVLHYGDSPTTADLITADVRSFLQQRFGDAGHGSYLIARPWAWYNHRFLDVSASGWKIGPATLRGEKDGFYGLAGVSFTGNKGASSRISLRRPGFTRLVVSYLAHPDGGTVEIRCGDVEVGVLETAAPQVLAARLTFHLPVEANRVELKVVAGTVRLFSVSLEKDPPGVVYDSLGLNGMWTGVLAHFVNEAHWAEELRQAHPNLVILNYGTNESGYGQYVDSTYESDLRQVLRRVRRALPHSACLVMSPMDRGVREKGGLIGTIPALPRLVSLQSKIALEEGCAFFNTFEAMGGPGTMGRWYMAEPRLVSADFIHPSPAGGRIVALLFYDALLQGYNQYKLRQLRNPVAEVRK